MNTATRNRDSEIYHQEESTFQNDPNYESTILLMQYDDDAMNYEEEFWCRGSKLKAAKKSGSLAVRPKKNNPHLQKSNIGGILIKQQAKDKEQKRRAREGSKKSKLPDSRQHSRKEQKCSLLQIERSARKIEKRASESTAQLLARKARIRSRVERQGIWRHSLESRWFRSEENYDPYQFYDAAQYEKQNNILPAQALGIEDKTMYKRLLDIVNGDDIQPEDFDMLLQLDTTNAKSTMDANEVSKFGVSIVDNNNEFRGEQCSICLCLFKEMEQGKTLRILPCGHVFCTECIDHWLTNNSVRCPELSCFWSEEKEESTTTTT